MRLTPFAALAVLPAAAALAAGCGGAGSGAPGGADGAATVVPAAAVAFVAAATDLESKRWHGLGKLALERLQGFGELRAAAGDEIDVATLGDGKTVAFARPDDRAKLDALAARRGLRTRTIGGWTALARDTDTLDDVAAARTHLADNTLFIDAMNHLPGDALVRGYANGERANALFASIPGQLESRLLPSGSKYRFKPDRSGRPTAIPVGTQEFRWLAAAITSDGDGLKLETLAAPGDLTAPKPPRMAIRPIAPYRPALPDEIPADALGVVDFLVPEGAFELTSLPPQLRALFGKGAVALPNELDQLLGGETALYIRAGLPIPEITLVTQPADTATASETLDSLLRELPAGALFGGLPLHRAVIGGQFVVSTTEKGIDAFRGSGAKLSSSSAFRSALERAGMPDRVTGFAYLNGWAALPLLGVANLPRVDRAFAFGARSQGLATLSAVLDLE
jgi:hypothetical protein